jgi:thiamine pyrophosphokinase
VSQPDVAIVVADGSIPERSVLDAAWPGWADGRRLVVAADGGAAGAVRLALVIDRVVGDLDSIAPALLVTLERDGATVERWPTDKDASDTELALRSALTAGPGRIVVLGATGGPRLDHALANVALLALDALAAVDVVLLDGSSRTRLLRGPAEATIEGRVGDLVSLLPLGGPIAGVTTRGLVYPLADEPLPAGSTRGLSNVRAEPTAWVRVTDGHLLVIESVVALEDPT